jgi:adenylosuccinate lyase
MRRYRVDQPYEKLKQLTRGQQISREELARFVDNLEIPEEAKSALKGLEPRTYIGNAPDQARAV